MGSAIISFLFTIGKMAIGFYLGSSNIASTFGAASSLAIVLLWTFYSAQIFFLTPSLQTFLPIVLEK